ncbi:MAG: rRNA maturation RNase YbeY [Gemmatimonadaceae bacterium]|nr:rRNA maturation RNase YbeY [Gemmatimonadaceae bacterium]
MCARSSRPTPTTRAVETAASRLAVDVSLGAQRIPLSADRVRDLVRRTLLAEHTREAMISVAFVSSREMARLNREHLGHAGPTDVISFALGLAPGPVQASVVGDIYICADVVRKNAARFGVGIREEIARVVVHGTLHTLGYEHPDGDERTGSEMWRKQEEILARVS